MIGPVYADPGSFRDPSGQVYIRGDQVFRTVMPIAAPDFEFVRATGLLESLVNQGKVIPETLVQPQVLGPVAKGSKYVVEHPKLPFISYPYEWPFGMLKAAALLHLDIHLAALENGVTLSDASAYNIQFVGHRPVFIDTLSFRRYREGEYWLGHRQFCEQFVTPLLLRASMGIAHNAWYRGNPEGIPVDDMNRLLSFRKKLSWNVFVHIVLQSSFQRKAARPKPTKLSKQRHLPKLAFARILKGLRRWITKLEPMDSSQTTWSEYVSKHSYSPDEVRKKEAFVSEFTRTVRPRMLWDIGCNTGDYSNVALNAGAQHVVGFDFDLGALEIAFKRAQDQELDFLPLFLDAANPSPSQGWAGAERLGLERRASGDAVLALAVVHHLAISRNIPLKEVLSWLVGLAPNGVIEFVQKSDPMVQELLRLREDIFQEYSEKSFISYLGSQAQIIRTETVSATGRRVFWYSRT